MSTVKKSFNEENIEAALADIKEKNTSIRKATFKYCIPFSTLIGRRNNNNVSFKEPGSTTVLLQQTESMIVHALSSFVFLTLNDVMDFVSGYLLCTNQSDLFKNGRPGKDWFYAFMNRWSKEITTRKTNNFASARVASCMQEIIDNFFEVVTKQYQLSGISSGCHYLYEL